MSSAILKKQLIAAVVMVLVALLALGTSTYAWFASNTQVTASAITATAQSTELLRIAKDNSNYSTSVDLGLTTNAFVPVSAGTSLLSTTGTTTVGTFYKVNGWEDETVTSSSDAMQLANTFTAATAETDYAVADIWLTDNNAASVYFSKKSTVLAKTTVTDPDTSTQYDVYAQFIAGSGITTYTLAKDTVLTFDADTGAITNTPAADVAVTTAAKTKLENALGALRLTFVLHDKEATPETGVNNASNTAATAAAKFYGFSNSTNGKYNTQNGTAGTNINADKRIASVAAGVATLEADSTTLMSNTEQLTTLKANEAQHFKVYCYLEGCDKQCITGIADDVTYTVSLGFSQASGQ